MGFVSAVPKLLGGILGDASSSVSAQSSHQAGVPQIDKQNFSKDIDYQRMLQEAAVNKQNQVYAQQQALADMLQQQSMGMGPNPAQNQYQQNIDQTGAQAAGLIASQKGISPALAARLAMDAQMGATQAGAGQAATLQAQQQIAATQALQNQQASMQQLGMDQGNQALTGQNVFQGAQANQNTALNQGTLGAQGINAQTATANAQTKNQAMQGILQGAGSAAMMLSDERVKKDVQDFDAASFLDSIQGKEFKYKSPEMGAGKQVGVMAQDVEKEVPQMVVETPEGKALDYNKAGGPIMASLSHLHERLKELEEARSGGGYGKVLAAKRKAKNG